MLLVPGHGWVRATQEGQIPSGHHAFVSMLGLIRGATLGRMVSVVAELGIADLVASGPRTAEELADATGTHAPSLFRLLRALSSVGVFAEIDGRRFRLTPLADRLRTDVPGSLRALAIMQNVVTNSSPSMRYRPVYASIDLCSAAR
jgi:hypothetical protein